MNKTAQRKIALAAVLAALTANAHAVQFEAGRGADVPQIAPIKTVPTIDPLAHGLPTVGLPEINAIPGAAVSGLETPQAITPEATPGLIPVAPETARLQQDGPAALEQSQTAAANFSDDTRPGGSGDWASGARTYDGIGKAFAPIDSNGVYFRAPSYNEGSKIAAARNWAAGKSAAFNSLDGEFSRKGGYFLINGNPSNGALASSGYDRQQRPVIVLSNDLLNRFNGRYEDEYRGAPWEFIASVIAREQVFSSDWYASIPASAEKLAASVMNQVRVFVDATDGTSRSWATDKDFQQTAGDPKSYVAWGWYEQLVVAARDAAANVGRSAGHLIDSKFLAWARDWVAPKEASDPAFQYTLWERYDGKYYRPGDPRNGQPIPANVPRIDKATYDRESYKVYGADGKASNQANQLDAQTIFGWIISWLRGRSEVL